VGNAGYDCHPRGVDTVGGLDPVAQHCGHGEHVLRMPARSLADFAAATHSGLERARVERGFSRLEAELGLAVPARVKDVPDPPVDALREARKVRRPVPARVDHEAIDGWAPPLERKNRGGE